MKARRMVISRVDRNRYIGYWSITRPAAVSGTRRSQVYSLTALLSIIERWTGTVHIRKGRKR